MANNATTKRVLFLDSLQFDFIKYELATIKYIKYSHVNLIYYAKDNKQTWELQFRDQDQKNETLVAKKRSDLYMHVCLQNTLVIEKVYF